MTKRIGASKSVIRHKQMKANRHIKEVSERKAQRKISRQLNSVKERYQKMNGSVFSENQTFKRLKPKVKSVLKIKNPDYNQRQHIKAVIRDFNNHETTSFNGSRKIYRSTVKTIYSHQNKLHGNKWKPLLDKDIVTPKSVQVARKFWKSYHKLNDLLESQHGSKNVFDSDTKLSYLTGNEAGSSDDTAMGTFNDLMQSATPNTGIIL
jgi:hypothetical protein